LIFVKPNQKKGSKYLSVIILLFGGFFSFTAYFTGNTYYTISIGAFYRTVISSQIIWYFGSHGQPSYSIYYYAPRFDVNFESENQPTKNIVFIVDETIRGDHLSLNGYSRPTTPLIDALNSKGFIKNWGIGASGATCSIQSNNLLLTGLNELRDAAGSKLYRLPTIFQYAKAMGYKTYYYDAQRSAVWNGKPTDLKYYERIDKVDFEAKTPTEIDAEIAVRVREKLENSTGNFIWINKFGNHMPYENNYPEDHVLWKPISTKNELATDRQPLINNYDNGIRYNLEIFFTNLFRNGVSNNTVYIYTSDHGESFVNQNGHCGTTKDEAIVPIFMIAQPHLLPGVDTGFKASHVNIFPTLLDLMEFPENQRQYNYALSLLKAKSTDSQPRFYYSERGEPNNPGKRYPFDE
jgi:glucan phosphoethanolaminetransferase (alkaline phosphatase superfamily)